MGCAGSRPNLLPNLSSNHNLSSPHKGFILFDSKTIEYLKVNELEIKQKLKERCELKLFKTGAGSKSSLLRSAKRTLLYTSNNANNTINSSDVFTNNGTAAAEAANSSKSNKLNGSLSVDQNEANSIKINMIVSAVEHVLKYALNDFDIENFKSSNQLSLKQIRKEIMKKNQIGKVSSSKLNNSLSMSNATASSSSAASNTATLSTSTTINDFSLHSNKSANPVFYKQALITAIDEFGLFIQENFIIINEFIHEDSATDQSKLQLGQTINEEKTEIKKTETESSESSEEEALKLKEALALARQNFYKGKVSTLCLTKTGGYVVKEIKDKQESDGLVIVAPPSSSPLPNSEPNEDIKNDDTSIEQNHSEQIKEQSALVESIPVVNDVSLTVNQPETEIPTQIQELADDVELIKRLINKAFDFSLQEKLTISEFSLIKTHMVNLLNETIESIVAYTTKSSAVNESCTDADQQFILDLNAVQHADLLISNLEKSKRIVENLYFVQDHDLESIDEKLVEAILNLDYVNKEFKSYLKILEESQIKELQAKKNMANKNFEDYIAKAENLLNKNIKIRMLADQIDELNAKLPKKLFACKCLPHPNQANQVSPDCEPTAKEQVIEDVEEEEEAITTPSVEITEVRVDSGTELLHVDVVEELKEMNKESNTTEASGSPISSMTSPSVTSTSSMSPPSAESISPVEIRHEQRNTKVDDDVKSPSKCNNLVEANLDQIEKFKCTAEEKLEINKISSSYMLMNGEISSNNRFNINTDENDSFNEIINNSSESQNLDKVKSSSSSSDILTSNSSNNNVDSHNCLINQQQDNLDTNSQEPVKFRSSDKSVSSDLILIDSIVAGSKRMSLDEELFYHLEEVDKKVKYMNETCSENEDDDEEENDEADFDYDPELENANDDERLFHPRTPAKIKNDIKSHRSADLQNEIKQISNVIQDLVQTINVRNSSSIVHTKIDIIDEVNETNGHLILSSFDDNNSDSNNQNNNGGDSEDGGSQNSADSTDTVPSSKIYYSRNGCGSHKKDVKRLSLNSSISNNNSFSNIPIRQKILTKQKATTIEDEKSIEVTSNKILSTSINYEAFVDVTTLIKQQQQQLQHHEQLASPDVMNKSTSSQKFRSKLPVKK